MEDQLRRRWHSSGRPWDGWGCGELVSPQLWREATAHVLCEGRSCFLVDPPAHSYGALRRCWPLARVRVAGEWGTSRVGPARFYKMASGTVRGETGASCWRRSAGEHCGGSGRGRGGASHCGSSSTALGGWGPGVLLLLVVVALEGASDEREGRHGSCVGFTRPPFSITCVRPRPSVVLLLSPEDDSGSSLRLRVDSDSESLSARPGAPLTLKEGHKPTARAHAPTAPALSQGELPSFASSRPSWRPRTPASRASSRPPSP